jgi:endonuclease IV
MVIKYKGFYNSTTTLVPKQKIPRNILGCDMRFPEKEDNAMEIEKIKKMYNKLDALKMLESNTIGIEDKMRIIDNYSILTPPELDEEPMEESDKKLLDSIRMRLNRTAQITEFWWFYDW